MNARDQYNESYRYLRMFFRELDSQPYGVSNTARKYHRMAWENGVGNERVWKIVANAATSLLTRRHTCHIEYYDPSKKHNPAPIQNGDVPY